LAIWLQFNDLDCRKCNTQIKKIRGCDKAGKEVTIEGIKIDRCPVKLISQETKLLLQAYLFYKNGFLYGDGNIASQSIRYIDTMLFIEQEVKRLEEKYGK
jgi:hypothetical protein